MNRPRTWQTLLAFATIYLVWGSTFLFIRIGVTCVLLSVLIITTMRPG